MKVLVISDTHGYIAPVIRYMKKYPMLFDRVWHLGDHFKDALGIASATGCDMIGVKGNCDSHANANEDEILEVSGKRVLLTHGHLYGVKHSLLRLHLKGLEDHLDLICFGHTHMATQTEEDGVILFNPGSASLPRLGGYPTIGLLTISENGIKTTIIPLLESQSSE
ncbi:metallophosphoesterase [Fusibacter bizertensis]|uniref:Phosphoesterase n=1 Tax=Fusibacter bizertensis TaxID=1488331 RepID=A0ABT6NF00_9FIRM|nr:metallophosphoesterase [Fusibacter bizertensis]MDH8678940.1 metallophosphoesterase [Fusibacter bizertensis]